MIWFCVFVILLIAGCICLLFSYQHAKKLAYRDMIIYGNGYVLGKRWGYKYIPAEGEKGWQKEM